MSRDCLTFTPEDARKVLWVQCLEEADATGAVVPVDVRVRAGREAGEGGDGVFLTRRADLLLAALSAEAQVPAVAGRSWLTRLPAWFPWGLIAAAFACGWVTGGFGQVPVISILSFPLLGLILWNLAVAAAAVAAEWRGRNRRNPESVRRPQGSGGLAAARAVFTARLTAWEKPRETARVKFLFHAAAMALAAGVVAGMYARGLATAYTVAWESTFLTAAQVRTLTVLVLSPASLLTGIPVPPPDQMGSAAPWIHLWAASALLFIMVPRVLLLNMARLQAAGAAPDYRKEFAGWLPLCRSLAGGHTLRAAILPVHYEPGPKVRDALRLLLQHCWGAQVRADFLSPVVYGDEEAVQVPGDAGFLVLLFPLTTTPESELHGALITALAAAGPGPDRHLVVLDAGAFEDRFRALPEFAGRLAARRAAWEKAAAGVMPVLVLDEAARRDPAAAVRPFL